jgi:hypothetical protein
MTALDFLIFSYRQSNIINIFKKNALYTTNFEIDFMEITNYKS